MSKGIFMGSFVNVNDHLIHIGMNFLIKMLIEI